MPEIRAILFLTYSGFCVQACSDNSVQSHFFSFCEYYICLKNTVLRD